MTKIEWCDEVINPITGCTHGGSPGCDNCYARRMAGRLAGRFGYPKDEPFRPGTIHEDKFREPGKWKQPKRIFVGSMGDVFHDALFEDKYLEALIKLFGWMAEFKQHTFIVLTKRPENAKRFCSAVGLYPAPFLGGGTPSGEVWPTNVWLGVSVSTQADADRWIPPLLDVPAAKRIVSAEPLLEDIDLYPYLDRWKCPQCGTVEKDERFCCSCGFDRWDDDEPEKVANIDWVIAGSESGSKRRPTKLYWFRSLRDQCANTYVPFFLKQAEIDGQLVKMPKLDGKEHREWPS